MSSIYTYDDWGQAQTYPPEYAPLKTWPPPATVHSNLLSGSAANLIGWRAAASLAVIFYVTDTAGAAPFTVGYEIPRHLKCRVVRSDQRIRQVPTRMIDSPWGRWGYLDDLDVVPGVPGCYTVSDWERLALNSDILTIGISFGDDILPTFDIFETTTPEILWPGGDPTYHLAAVSAMTGAGVELDLATPGHVLIHDYYYDDDGSGLAAQCIAAITAYAAERNAHTIDVAWAVDNTGSMGSDQDLMKAAAVQTTQALLDTGFDAWFAYATFADWSYADFLRLPLDQQDNASFGAYEDDPYQVRFPFSPLTEATQEAFAALVIEGQAGDDTPEAGLEALCRMYVARRQVLKGAHLLGGVHMDPKEDLSGRMLAR